jgi:lipid A disaccharide synthetase
MFGLPNLIAEKLIVKERIQHQANPEILEQDLQELIDNVEVKSQMIAELRSLKSKLGDVGATVRVASALEKYFKS